MRRCAARNPSAALSPAALRICSAKTGVYSIQWPSPSMTGCESLAWICSGVACALMVFSGVVALAAYGAVRPGLLSTRRRNQISLDVRRCEGRAQQRPGSAAGSVEGGEQLVEGGELVAVERIGDEDRGVDAGGMPGGDAIAHLCRRPRERVVGDPAIGQIFPGCRRGGCRRWLFRLRSSSRRRSRLPSNNCGEFGQ